MRPRCPQSERYPLLHPSRTLPAGADLIDAPAAIDIGDPATTVTMDPATTVTMDLATTVGGGQVWGSMSDLVGVGGISLRSIAVQPPRPQQGKSVAG
jgi:hypothetical protein